MQVFSNSLAIVVITPNVQLSDLQTVEAHTSVWMSISQDVLTFGQLSWHLTAWLGGGCPASPGVILTCKRGLPHNAARCTGLLSPDHTDLSSPWEPGVRVRRMWLSQAAEWKVKWLFFCTEVVLQKKKKKKRGSQCKR